MTDPAPRITDDEVAALPVHAGRADLLEDLMATPVIDRTELVRPRARRLTPTWLAIPAAAAAIAAIAVVPALRGDDGPRPGPGSSVSEAPAATDGEYLRLDARGWKVDDVGESGGLLSVSFEKGDLTLEVNEYPAESYQSYYDDRLDVSSARQSTLLGLASSTFTYSARDHATIRPAEGDSFVEVRADGMGLADYEELLGRLEATDVAGFAEIVPPGTLTPATRDSDVARLLEGVRVPEGFTAADVEADGFLDAYNAMTTVAGAVGCAWLEAYDAGDAPARQEALRALDGSRDWPLLVEQEAVGDYPEVFWTLAGDLRAGARGAELHGAIGC
ncbi:hypothetical protein [Nocardioides sp.]|uniref:hypothetical protein n=1 Tax=Nocardioides sp. TaxID=35761 RepID=UPI00286B0913|nr:hypothetical protein [Nocardioides sp.]